MKKYALIYSIITLVATCNVSVADSMFDCLVQSIAQNLINNNSNVFENNNMRFKKPVNYYNNNNYINNYNNKLKTNSLFATSAHPNILLSINIIKNFSNNLVLQNVIKDSKNNNFIKIVNDKAFYYVNNKSIPLTNVNNKKRFYAAVNNTCYCLYINNNNKLYFNKYYVDQYNKVINYPSIHVYDDVTSLNNIIINLDADGKAAFITVLTSEDYTQAKHISFYKDVKRNIKAINNTKYADHWTYICETNDKKYWLILTYKDYLQPKFMFLKKSDLSLYSKITSKQLIIPNNPVIQQLLKNIPDFQFITDKLLESPIKINIQKK